MAEQLSDQELLALIKQRAYTDPNMRASAKAMGISVDVPDAPPELNTLFDRVREELRKGIADFDEDVRKAIATAKPAFVIEVGIDMLDANQPHLFHGNISDVEGKAGKQKVFLDEDGRMWSDRVSYLHAGDNHVTDKVVSRQTGDELRRVWVDESGVPTHWYNSSADDKIGEEISEDFLATIREANNL